MKVFHLYRDIRLKVFRSVTWDQWDLNSSMTRTCWLNGGAFQRSPTHPHLGGMKVKALRFYGLERMEQPESSALTWIRALDQDNERREKGNPFLGNWINFEHRVQHKCRHGCECLGTRCSISARTPFRLWRWCWGNTIPNGGILLINSKWSVRPWLVDISPSWRWRTEFRWERKQQCTRKLMQSLKNMSVCNESFHTAMRAGSNLALLGP